MASVFRMLLVGSVAVFLAGSAFGQTTDKLKPDAPPKDYRWEDIAKKMELGEKNIELLRKNKFVITNESRKQIFSPYLGGEAPLFITTDSLLNGYHVLFEESIYRLETANARKLPTVLDKLANNLDQAAKAYQGDADQIAAARKRAFLFLAVARNLLDAKTLPEDAALRKLVQEEVERITAAKETSKPAWLGPPDDGFKALAYARFQPRGFYTKSPLLQRYFRAVAWLQAIPFRLDNDEELAAFFVLRRAYCDPKEEYDPKRDAFWRVFSAFLCAKDDWDLPSADDLPKEMTKDGLADVRKNYKDRVESRAKINDQLRFAPAQPGGKTELEFRFLSAYRLPDAVLFQRTSRPEVEKRDFPDGLEVCAALGSPFARDKLKREHPKVMKEIEQSRPLFEDASLYGQYLQCLAILLERTEPDAPKFLHEEAWKIKTCQTALGSWAQMRHTWALQAKQGANYVSGSYCPTGFVEPVPEFYGRMAKLMEATRETLDEAGALAPTDPMEMLQEVKQAWTIVEKLRKEKKGLDSLSADERALLTQFDPRLNGWWEKPETGNEAEKTLNNLERTLDYYQLALGKADKDDLRNAYLSLLGVDNDIASKWAKLTRLCHRLEILSHKQLRQVPFSDEENKFLQDYGKQLANIMLYGGNSYGHPRDDAPRVVDVFTNPMANKRLLVGTGQARLLWVLYPVKGVDVLCRGAVLPYYEFTQAQPLTDAAWKSLLDSPQRPQAPQWVRPVFAPPVSDKPDKDK